MSPAGQWAEDWDRRFPRVSGDEPPALTDFMGVVAFSPRERG